MRSQTLQSRKIVPAERLETLRYAIRDIEAIADELAFEGREILRLNIGDPLKFDYATPPHLIEAVVKALQCGKNGYAPSNGVPPAMEALHQEAERKSIRNVQAIFITQGVSEGIEICLSALVNPGENILLPCPEYPCYSAVLKKIGAEANLYQLEEEHGWEPNVERLAEQINGKTRALVVINPNNPTGAAYSRQTLAQISNLAREHNLVLISDETYDKLSLEEEKTVPSLASFDDDLPTVTLNGLSKTYLVPGWRLGWCIVSGERDPLKPYVETMQKILRTRLSANHAEQYAIPAALNGSHKHIAEMRRKLQSRRDLMLKWFNQWPGMSCVPPRAAFYAFPRIRIAGNDKDFVKKLLLEKGVLLVPGSGFGQQEGTHHFRFVYLAEECILEEACRRMQAFLEEHYAGEAIKVD